MFLINVLFAITALSDAYPTPFKRSDDATQPSTIITLSASSAAATATTTTTPTSQSSPKYVVAHHMVGNTFSYTIQDWTDDITLAHESGIDGFALNMGRDEWQPQRVNDAYQAALQSGLEFKLFLSLDMTSLPCASSPNAQSLRSLVQRFSSHPNQFQYGSSNSRALVSTFAGEACTFGQPSASEGWRNEFVQHPDIQSKILFVPSFFVDPSTFGAFGGAMQGDFNWNSGWPVELTSASAHSLVAKLKETSPSVHLSDFLGSSLDNAVDTIASLADELGQIIGGIDSDKLHLDGLKALESGISARQEQDRIPYMAAVSPWFFTHYGPDTFNKNFIFFADQHLYPKRWESLVAARESFDIVQLISWNDWGESHYVSPVKGDQPGSEAWTDGMPHDGWLPLTKYYATAFKTGSYPEITNDEIFLWSRPHSGSAEANADPVGKPENFELVEDAIWAVVLTTDPSTVTLSTSDNTSQSFEVPAGLSKLSLPISAGGTMKATIQRDGQIVLELAPQEFTFQGNPQTYNFNAFVATVKGQ